jgi:ubiquinone/menaquinone biosynthesis C-methylase UbiE
MPVRQEAEMTVVRGETRQSYILLEDDRERRRLLLQSSLLNPLTERFLRNCGIAQGMRILDLGCGVGDVSMIAAGLAGPTGEVVGIDLSERSLELARERAREAHFHHLRFECANFLEYRAEARFDAVIGRHFLLHAAAATDVLRHIASLLSRGGLAAFQEYDFSNWRVGCPETPLASQIAGSMLDLFWRAAASPDIGLRLYSLMLEAGFREVRSTGECVIDGGPESPCYEWFAETALSMLPKMRALGIAAAVGDETTLAARLAEEFTSARACICSPLIVSTAARWSH